MNENPFGLNTITKEHWDEVSIAPVGFFGTTPDPDNLLIVKDFVEKEDLKKIQEFYSTITKWIPTPEDAEMDYNDKGQVIYNPDFWRGNIVPGVGSTHHSTYGARSKVDFISKTDLLRARGFKV